ncbi:MAG: glycosyltransferase [Candidatus Binataceae bacterium]
MRRVIARLLSERRHDLIHVQLSRMAGLLEGATPIPRVIDFVDALSLNLRRRAAHDRLPLNLVARAEASRLLRYEREVCRTWDRAMVVSAVDRAAIGDFPNLGVNPSGVDLEAFPYRNEGREPSTIVFSGNLGYFSNVDAISWFAREIFPRIVREAPNAKLLIVGARPSRKVTALANLDPRIRIIGMVDLLQPYLQRCTVAIAPMRAGSGQLFKILEAMASGAPLVATSRAAEAIEAESGRHLFVADDAESFARAALRLIHEPALGASIAQEARRLVESHYRWESSVAELEESYRLATKQRCYRANQSAAR